MKSCTLVSANRSFTTNFDGTLMSDLLFKAGNRHHLWSATQLTAFHRPLADTPTCTTLLGSRVIICRRISLCVFASMEKENPTGVLCFPLAEDFTMSICKHREGETSIQKSPSAFPTCALHACQKCMLESGCISCSLCPMLLTT